MLPDHEELTACACVLYQAGTRLIWALGRWENELQLEHPDKFQEMVDGLGRTHSDCIKMLVAATSLHTDGKPFAKHINEIVEILREAGAEVITPWSNGKPRIQAQLRTRWKLKNPLHSIHKRATKWRGALERQIHKHRIEVARKTASPPLNANNLTFFFASSSEAKLIARQIIRALRKSKEAKKWKILFWSDRGVFTQGESTLESLENIFRKCDFGIYLLTPDDKTVIRQKRSLTARGNVIFELGMGVARHGRRRSLIVHEKIYQISDLDGITKMQYEKAKTAKTPSSTEINRIVQEIVTAVHKQCIDSDKP